MTDPTYHYPPPVPPAPPARSRVLPVLAAVGGIVLGLATLGAIVAEDEAAAPATTASPAATADPADSLRQWVADHGDRSAAVIGVIEGYASDIAYYAGQGDLIEVLALCRDGARYMADAALEPVSLSPDAPAEWSRMVDAYSRGMSACADGDLELSTAYIGDGTQAMRDLTERLRQL